MLERVRVNLGTGVATFRVSPEVWKLILDFTKGYRKYELKTTMQFKSVYSMRFYELLSGQKAPLSFSLEELKKMLKLDDYTDKTESITERNINEQMISKEHFRCCPGRT